MDLAVIIFLILLGIFLLVLEILVVPGGILAIVSLCMIGIGVYNIYAEYGRVNGHIGLAATIVISAGVVLWSLKSGAWKRFAQHGKLEGRVNDEFENKIKAGDIGIAVSELRPMGNALFGDEKYEVSSEGEKIPVHTRLEIIKIEGNKIVVRKTE